MREARIGEHVLCSRLGTEEFKVVRVDRDEFVLESTVTKKRESIFKVHCHQTLKMVFESRDRIKANADTIGRPKIRPGKKK